MRNSFRRMWIFYNQSRVIYVKKRSHSSVFKVLFHHLYLWKMYVDSNGLHSGLKRAFERKSCWSKLYASFRSWCQGILYHDLSNARIGSLKMKQCSQRPRIFDKLELCLNLNESQKGKQMCYQSLLAWHVVACHFRVMLSRLSRFCLHLKSRLKQTIFYHWVQLVSTNERIGNFRLLRRISKCCLASEGRLHWQSERDVVQIWILGEKSVQTERTLLKYFKSWRHQVQTIIALLFAVTRLRLRQSLSRLFHSYHRWRLYLLCIASFHQHCQQNFYLRLS